MTSIQTTEPKLIRSILEGKRASGEEAVASATKAIESIQQPSIISGAWSSFWTVAKILLIIVVVVVVLGGIGWLVTFFVNRNSSAGAGTGATTESSGEASTKSLQLKEDCVKLSIGENECTAEAVEAKRVARCKLAGIDTDIKVCNIDTARGLPDQPSDSGQEPSIGLPPPPSSVMPPPQKGETFINLPDVKKIYQGSSDVKKTQPFLYESSEDRFPLGDRLFRENKRWLGHLS